MTRKPFDPDEFQPVPLADPEPVAASASAAPTKTVEAWGEAKGIWPQFQAPPRYGAQGGQPTGFGTVAINMQGMVGPKPNPEYWRFAAARAVGNWPEGKEMTEAEFDAAVKAAGEHVGR